MINDYFKVYTNCVVTKGYTKSLISDLQRQKSRIIPNSMAEIIGQLNNKQKISTLVSKYRINNEETLQQYLDFLIEEDYGFYCNAEEFERFPNMDIQFQSACKVSNTLIEITNYNLHHLKGLIEQIENIGCKDVGLIFYDTELFSSFLFKKDSFNDSTIKSVEIITPYNSNFDEDFLHKISIDFERITSLYIYNSPFNKRTEWNNKILMDVIFAKKNYTDFRFCGGVNIETFNTNLPKVLEAINHNSCLHKKISIDVDGNIRNCPSMPQSFGNIKDTTLEEALEHPDFKKYWNLTKDHIEVCKDCEFRYICTDCRAYTERTHTNAEGLDISKPLKCGYNPYTGEWEEWSTNPLKEKAIEFYGMEDMVKK